MTCRPGERAAMETLLRVALDDWATAMPLLGADISEDALLRKPITGITELLCPRRHRPRHCRAA